MEPWIRIIAMLAALTLSAGCATSSRKNLTADIYPVRMTLDYVMVDHGEVGQNYMSNSNSGSPYLRDTDRWTMWVRSQAVSLWCGSIVKMDVDFELYLSVDGPLDTQFTPDSAKDFFLTQFNNQVRTVPGCPELQRSELTLETFTRTAEVDDEGGTIFTLRSHHIRRQQS